MKKKQSAAILHSGPWKKVFGQFPEYLSRLTGWPIVEDDRDISFGYVLGWDEEKPPRCQTYIPFEAILSANDKREQYKRFKQFDVRIPETHLIDTKEGVFDFFESRPDKKWVLKWPDGCGGMGHQLLSSQTQITAFWRAPFLVQEFIRMNRPQVFRLTAADGIFFNWCVRKFPAEKKTSPWVSHALGAKFESIDQIPDEVEIEVKKALLATELFSSFGAVDLIQSEDGKWLVLEVNTDGVYHYVTREVGLPEYTKIFDQHIISSLERHLNM